MYEAGPVPRSIIPLYIGSIQLRLALKRTLCLQIQLAPVNMTENMVPTTASLGARHSPTLATRAVETRLGLSRPNGFTSSLNMPKLPQRRRANVLGTLQRIGEIVAQGAGAALGLLSPLCLSMLLLFLDPL